MAVKTVRQMIDWLEQFEDDAPVLVASQPAWPLALEIENIGQIDPLEDLDAEESENGEDGVQPVWICTGGHPYGRSQYAPKAAWDA